MQRLHRQYAVLSSPILITLGAPNHRLPLSHLEWHRLMSRGVVGGMGEHQDHGQEEETNKTNK